MKRNLILFIILPVLIFTSFPASSATITKSDFNNARRRLLEDHITWTHLYIVSAVTNKTKEIDEILAKHKTNAGVSTATLF
jgi:hypothetical protein